MPQLTSEQKKIIINEVKNGKSSRSIASDFGISHTTVWRMFQKFCKEGEKCLSSKSGKKKKLTKSEILILKRISNKNPFLTAREVRDEAGLNQKISIPTACRYLTQLKL